MFVCTYLKAIGCNCYISTDNEIKLILNYHISKLNLFTNLGSSGCIKINRKIFCKRIYIQLYHFSVKLYPYLHLSGWMPNKSRFPWYTKCNNASAWNNCNGSQKTNRHHEDRKEWIKKVFKYNINYNILLPDKSVYTLNYTHILRYGVKKKARNVRVFY